MSLDKPTLLEAVERLARVALKPGALNDRTGRRILISSILLGLLGDALFHRAAAGLNFPLWVAAAIGCYLFCWQGRGMRPPAHQLLLLGLSLLFAAMVAWRGSPVLLAFNVMASMGCLTLAVALPLTASLRRTSLLGLVVVGAGAGTGFAAGLPRLIVDGSWSRRLGVRSRENTLVASRVVLLTAPLLVSFGGLFVAADAVFQSRVEGLLNFNPTNVWEHMFLFLGAAWLACGLLWTGLVAELPGDVAAELPEEKRLRWLETGVVLSSLVALFAAFVLVQVRYLFGGESLVQETIGLTYAQYARRGFFELVAAAALLLPVLLALDWARRRDRISGLVFRLLAGVLVLLLFVVMISALERMRVYMDAFGLTELRLYVVTILFALGGVFVWFLWAVLRERREEFALGAGVVAVVALLALNIFNPDALIAGTNTTRLSEGRTFDAYHASRLGPEAAPILVNRLDRLNVSDACTVARSLLAKWSDDSGDLRSWNLGRERARDAVADHRAELIAAC